MGWLIMVLRYIEALTALYLVLHCYESSQEHLFCASNINAQINDDSNELKLKLKFDCIKRK